MKNKLSILLLILISASVVFTSCEKGEVEKKFDLTLTNFVLNTDGRAGFGTDTTLGTQVLTTGIEAKLNENGATLQNIKKIELKSVDLTITTPAGQTFDGIDYIASYIRAGSLGETKVAYKVPIPQTGLITINQDSQFSDLTEYIKQPEFTFILTGYNSIPVPAMTLSANISFSITVLVAK